MDYGLGVYGGITKGAFESGKQLVSFAAQAITNPIKTGHGVYEAFSNLAKLACSQEWKILSQTIVPEVYDLIEKWEEISPKERGEKSGYIVGKYGADILIPGASCKAVSQGVKGAKEIAVIAKNLQKAEKVVILEALAETGGSGAFKEVVYSNRVFERAASTGKIIEGFSIKQLSNAGKIFDRGGLTKAGRALAKHGGRKGSIFSKPKGSPNQINQQGQAILESILNDSRNKIIKAGNQEFKIFSPDGRGLHFKNNKLVGFVEGQYEKGF